MMRLGIIVDFLRLEAASGIILMLAALVALIVCQSPGYELYQALGQYPVFMKPLTFWINEGLMTFFFLLVGLELKRECLEGELQGGSQVILPAAAALGGMIIPCLIYFLFNSDNQVTFSGWSIPLATDIAFALGVLSLFGRRVPLALKLFLMALAVFDDVGAILIIALYYTQSLSLLFLFVSFVLVCVLFLMNQLKISQLGWYIIVGFLLWMSLLFSGVHPTVAGVLLALAIPLKKNHDSISPLKQLENHLHPWVAFGVMPLFAFMNAGISFATVNVSLLFSNVTLGVALGLFLGKQLGVYGFSRIIVLTKWTTLPREVTWFMLYSVAVLCGVGFTMSLFLGTLTFPGKDVLLGEVRLGVLIGSALSSLAAIGLLHFSLKRGNNKIDAE